MALLVLIVGCVIGAFFGIRALLPAMPRVGIDEVVAPKTESVVFGPGMDLEKVAAAAYGERHFAVLLAQFHHVSESRIPDGMVIRTPSIPRLFQQAGLEARYQPAINALARAAQEFYTARPAYELERKGVLRWTKFRVSDAMSRKLFRLADELEMSGEWLAKQVAAPQTVPKLSIGHFNQAAAGLRSLAKGVVEEYDMEMIGQHFGHGFQNLLAWVEMQYR